MSKGKQKAGNLIIQTQVVFKNPTTEEGFNKPAPSSSKFVTLPEVDRKKLAGLLASGEVSGKDLKKSGLNVQATNQIAQCGKGQPHVISGVQTLLSTILDKNERSRLSAAIESGTLTDKHLKRCELNTDQVKQILQSGRGESEKLSRLMEMLDKIEDHQRPAEKPAELEALFV